MRTGPYIWGSPIADHCVPSSIIVDEPGQIRDVIGLAGFLDDPLGDQGIGNRCPGVEHEGRVEDDLAGDNEEPSWLLIVSPAFWLDGPAVVRAFLAMLDFVDRTDPPEFRLSGRIFPEDPDHLRILQEGDLAADDPIDGEIRSGIAGRMLLPLSFSGQNWVAATMMATVSRIARPAN